MLVLPQKFQLSEVKAVFSSSYRRTGFSVALVTGGVYLCAEWLLSHHPSQLHATTQQFWFFSPLLDKLVLLLLYTTGNTQKLFGFTEK